VLNEAFLASLPEERERLVAKLKAEGQIHFNDYDRAKAEAELRYSAAVPVGLLSIVMAVSWSPLAILGLIVPTLMVRQGLEIERDGYADLYLALQYGAVQAPTMGLLYEVRAKAQQAKAASLPAVGGPLT
jgi:hypothetical protein